MVINKMSKIFIYSNSFVATTVLFQLPFTFKIKFDEILLLKENHKQNENNSHKLGIKINLYNSIDDCINFCNYVLIIKDDNTPIKQITYILHKSKEFNKSCFEIVNPWSEELTCEVKQSE